MKKPALQKRNPIHFNLVDSESSSIETNSQLTQDFNDKESSIIESSLSSVNGGLNFAGSGPHINQLTSQGNYKKIFGRNNANFFQLKASWVKDNSKSILVDIDENETVGYLLMKIGERMEETHYDFRGLRHCQAAYIFQNHNNHLTGFQS